MTRLQLLHVTMESGNISKDVEEQFGQASPLGPSGLILRGMISAIGVLYTSIND